MFSERPSQRKVVGVSRRYLSGLGYSHDLSEYTHKFTTENLKQFEAMRIGSLMATLAISKIIRMPLQATRRSYLSHAQEVEGYVMGEEVISIFAQRRINDHEKQMQ